MQKKASFPTELSYLVGLILLALGTAFMEAADFGVSMIVAPAYLLHLKMSEFFPFFTFGMAEYIFQGTLIVLLAIVMRRFRLAYLFSFVTAVIYGLMLDGWIYVVSFIPCDTLPARLIVYIGGFLICAIGVAFLFHTYLPQEAYELFVAEVTRCFGFKLSRVKTIYDYSSCVFSILLSFIFFGFGHFEGIKLGSIICALLNGFTIGVFSKCLEKFFDFGDKLKLRAFFQY